MIYTLSAFWRQSGLLVVVSVCIRNTDSFILCVHARLIASAFDHTHTHTRTHARTHARAHARTHTLFNGGKMHRIRAYAEEA